MRILHVSNHSVQRCGIANFGHQLTTALRRAGAEVTDWDGQYSQVYERVQRGERAYLPDNAESYDVIHFNWHPIVINHYGPGHFPMGTGKPILSVYLNDIPPWSGCPVADRADVLIAAEESPGCKVLPYPICDWLPDLPPASEDFTVGWSGVRGDGADLVRSTCEALGYATNAPVPGVWTTYEEEIARLARSTVNVSWYHEGRGISGGASQMASARRPVIYNDSPMFAHLWPWEGEFYFHLEADPDLGDALREVHEDWRNGNLLYPSTVLDGLSWSRAATHLLQWWEEAIRD